MSVPSAKKLADDGPFVVVNWVPLKCILIAAEAFRDNNMMDGEFRKQLVKCISDIHKWMKETKDGNA